MTPRQQAWGAGTGLAMSLAIGGIFVGAGLQGGDLSTAVVGVAIPVVTLLLGGPVLRWFRRGDGPYATRSATDDGREAYVRLRHSGGNGHGR